MRNLKRRFGANSLRATWTTSILSLTAVAALSTTSFAQQSGTVANDKIISIDLRDVRLEAAISALTNSTGLSNVVIQAVPGKTFQLVNVKLVDQPMSRALSAIAASAGAILTQTDGIYYVRPRSESDVAPTAKPEPGNTQQSDDVKAAAASSAATRQRPRNATQATIKLNYMLPSEMVKYLNDPNYIAIITKDSDVSAMAVPFGGGSLSPKSASAPPVPIVNKTFGPDGTVTTGPADLPPPISGGTGGLGGSAGRSDDSYTQGQRGVGGQGAGGGRGAGAGIGGAPGGGGQGQQTQSVLGPSIRNVISNDADNALIVLYDDPDDLRSLQQLVKQLDKAPQQVLIKAEFINVSISDADSFGINWHFQPAGNLDALIPAAAGQSGTASILLAYSSGNAVANLQATLSHDTSNVLQAPIITTENNKLATINVATVVTVPVTQIIASNNSAPITSTYQQPVTASNGIVVLPHINGDGTINLHLVPQLQTVAVTATGGITETIENLDVYRRVASGETMVLGGFINKTDTFDLQKVPILSDLPIIGNLFTQKSHSVQGSEILVFVTATIIDDHAQGTLGIGGGSPAPTP